MRIPLPGRPKHEVAATVYDVLTVVGVTLSVALIVAQLVLRLPIKV
jgi:hypothetical protein